MGQGLAVPLPIADPVVHRDDVDVQVGQALALELGDAGVRAALAVEPAQLHDLTISLVNVFDDEGN